MGMAASALGQGVRDHLLTLTGPAGRSLWRRSTALFAMGQPAVSIFFLESGLVKLSRHAPPAREILLDLVSPGELFGEHAVLQESPRQTTAEVLHDSMVWEIPRQLFLEFADSHPEVWRDLAALLAARGRRLEAKLERIVFYDVRQRILFSLAELAENLGMPGGEKGFSIHLSQVELANIVGATRETTSTALNVLERTGLVSLGRRCLNVSPPDVLRSAAAQCEPQSQMKLGASA
jgi:CRP-like cAMP-binding protein